MKSKRVIWFLSEVYYPDEQGTAFYTTGIAEGLARDFTVKVLCSCPTVTARGASVARREVRKGVQIERCMGTTFNKDILPLRLINLFSYSIAIFFMAVARIKRGDIVIAVTSPPSAPFIAKMVCALRGASCVLRLEDVYPEVLVATGMIGKESFANRVLGLLNKWLYRSVDHITVLGRDMKTLAEKKLGGKCRDVRLIRSWADTDIVCPIPKEDNALLGELGLRDKFIVSCIGNMGRAQAVELMFEAVSRLKEHDGIHFLFIGSGAKRKWMEDTIRDRGLSNITFVNQRPREEQPIFLNACDISIISLLPGMTGAGVPSRTYNIMAAGKPVIALTCEHSEVALLVQEENIGWVVPPGDPSKLVQAILDAQSEPEKLKHMGQRAAAAANEKFSRSIIIEKYHDLIEGM